MRIWSIHPKYLDSKGLVALWRETLLAKNVLENKTKGYKNHPQLERFKTSTTPLHCVNQYLEEIFNEACRRHYSFDLRKINLKCKRSTLQVTSGQLDFEMEHLKRKLRMRDMSKLREVRAVKTIEPHPLFTVIEGEAEKWEKNLIASIPKSIH
jgi:hypothetical protein